MAGVKSAKQLLDDPATALRTEQQRRKVVEMGGPHAASEAEELAKLHEWQMGALGRPAAHRWVINRFKLVTLLVLSAKRRRRLSFVRAL